MKASLERLGGVVLPLGSIALLLCGVGCTRIGYDLDTKPDQPDATSVADSSGDHTLIPGPTDSGPGGDDTSAEIDGNAHDGNPEDEYAFDVDPDGAIADSSVSDGGVSVSDGGWFDADEPETIEDPCGNGVVEGGEECDPEGWTHVDWQCDNCRLVPPSAWNSCDVSSSPASTAEFYFFRTVWSPSGSFSWHTAQQYCQDLARDALGPDLIKRGATGGLAVLPDRVIWDCVRGTLNSRNQYWVGLRAMWEGGNLQWKWQLPPLDPALGLAGTNFDDASSPVDSYFDGESLEGDPGSAQCVRLDDRSPWLLADDFCDTQRSWRALCMVAYIPNN
jgi:hypothetical protein